MKTCLVLEGGALRGIYTAGVLDVLLENKIEVDTIIGVSAGALFGINYVSKQKGRCLRYNLANAKNKHYMGFYSWLTTGNIMNEEFCFHTLIYETDPFDFETFNKSKKKFYAVVTNIETGKPEYIQIKDSKKDMEYLRASGSMPLVSKVVEIKGKKYLDGGVADSIPYVWAKENGYDRIVVVETRPIDYEKKESSMAPFKLKYKKYPNLIKTLQERPKSYNETTKLIREEEGKECFVIRPSRFVDIKRIEHDRRKIQEMYDLGVEDAKKALKSLIQYIQ